MQAADFVAYHLRKCEIIEREDTLSRSRANGLLVELLEAIAELQKNVVRVKVV